METINTCYADYKSLVNFVNNHRGLLYSPAKPAVLVQIFSSWCEPAFLATVAAEISGLLPHAHIIGTTTSGEIMDGQVSGLKTVLAFSVFEHCSLQSGLIAKNEQDDFALGRQAAESLGSEQAKILLLFATALSVNAKEMLLGVQSVYPRLPVAGGYAGSQSLTSPSFVLCGSEVSDSGVAGVALTGESLAVHCYSHLGWQPIGKAMTITKADRTRVYTIDHMPAYEVYRKYLGLDEIKNFSTVTEYPLVVQRQGVLTARTPNSRYEDGSIGFAGELTEGEKARFSFGHVGVISEAVDSLCRKIRQQPAQSIYIYSCECRRGFLQESSRIETEPLQNIAPTAGFFTHGEFFHVDGTNQLLNATMTVVVLAETGESSTTVPAASLPANLNCKEILYIDKVAERNTGVLKALTHLVNTVTAELISANEKLNYISLHDSLTGLYNRTFFEQEMRRLDTLANPVGVLVCDLDFLKKLNDVLGHHIGDRILRLAADVITYSCPQEAIIARIGGDEFAILLVDAKISSLADIARTIAAEAVELRRQSRESLLFLSVGYALKGPGGLASMSEAFKLADANMYHNKLAAKASTRREIIHSIKTFIKSEE